jgi:hypothetical protein
MKPTEMVVLTELIQSTFPHQTVGEYTSDAWEGVLGDLALPDCKAAVAAIAKRQPFCAASDIRAEVKRIREARLSARPLPAPPPELADEPGRYKRAIQAAVRRIADGFAVPPALEGAPREGEPPEEYQAARKALPEPTPAKPDYQALAREQAAQARREREGGAA